MNYSDDTVVAYTDLCMRKRFSLKDSRLMTNAQKKQHSSKHKSVGRIPLSSPPSATLRPPNEWSRRSKQRFRNIMGRLKRSATLAVVSASLLLNHQVGHAQFGAMPMNQSQGVANGVANRGLSRLGALNDATPGFLYYGVNGAGRGLGYFGSYMTLGGFIPYAQDDLGGFWNADLRGHLSTNGGFFSNVGIVRKQLTDKGSLLGVGVYWDYDGDLNQYAGQGGEQYGQFGHVYQQVGVSGELLTDYGNIRSNGYVPVGTTAYTVGAPGYQYDGRHILCQYGLDAALGGADLEVGAWVPALAQWAGMISVGGYALGNTFNKWQLGTRDGQAIVPWFGGVYTRMDVTVANNWDVSLQYNNDSFFNSTGFARLTYRMGGSRRRNVPDQLEQPMMRNEHIVRAHQTPEVGMNTKTGLAWNIIHVDNSAPAGGNGTVQAPFNTLELGNSAATNPADIVFVHTGNGTYNQTATFTPLAANQKLIGDGAKYCLDTMCGPINMQLTNIRPTISNGAGASVNLGSAGATQSFDTANFIVSGSRIGVEAGIGLIAGSQAQVINYEILSGGAGGFHTGLEFTDVTGATKGNPGYPGINVVNTSITDMNDVGIRVNGGAPTLAYQGSVTNNSATGGTSPLIEIENTTGAGEINIAAGSTPGSYIAGDPRCIVATTVPNILSDTGGSGIVIKKSNSDITMDNLTITDSVNAAISATDSNKTINIGLNGPASIAQTPGILNPSSAGILVDGGAPTFTYSGSIINDIGNAVRVNDTGGSVTVTNPGGSSTESGLGIVVSNNTGDVTVENFAITDTTGPGILAQNNKFAASKGATFNNMTITQTNGSQGVNLSNNSGGNGITLNNVNVTTATGIGLFASTNDIITMTGTNPVTSTNAAAVSISNGSGDHTLLFSDISSTLSNTNGVFLSGITGGTNTFDVTGGITIDQASGPSLLMQGSNITANVPLTTITNGSGGGIQLVNMNENATETLTFSAANITTTGNGLSVSNTTTPYNLNGLITFGGGSISTTNGTAINATNANLQANFASVQAAGASTGISLVGSGSTGASGIGISSTNLTAITGTGIFLLNNAPVGNTLGSYADFGILSIAGTGTTGISVAGTNASFSGASIDGFTTGVSLTSSTGTEPTIFEMQSSSILNATTGVFMSSTAPANSVNATLTGNSISAATTAINATNAGGTIVIDANNNTQPGASSTYNLDNTAKITLGISQADTGSMGAANNGATVSPSGTITAGATPLVP